MSSVNLAGEGLFTSLFLRLVRLILGGAFNRLFEFRSFSSIVSFTRAVMASFAASRLNNTQRVSRGHITHCTFADVLPG